MSNKKRIVIIGATSAIAKHCARLWAAESPSEIILVGRDLQKTEVVAADLRVRTPKTTITRHKVNFLDPSAIQVLVDELTNATPVDLVLIAHGMLSDQQQCQRDLTECHKALEINAISPVLFAEAFVAKMQQANKGVIALIGSVAGDRGRKSNYIYGAAKGLITCYVQGLQHRLANSQVKAVLIKPGPTDTPMTTHFKQQGVRMASVEEVTKCIVSGIDLDKSVIYAPAKWRLIMMIVRHLPRFIFNKMDI